MGGVGERQPRLNKGGEWPDLKESALDEIANSDDPQKRLRAVQLLEASQPGFQIHADDREKARILLKDLREEKELKRVDLNAKIEAQNATEQTNQAEEERKWREKIRNLPPMEVRKDKYNEVMLSPEEVAKQIRKAESQMPTVKVPVLEKAKPSIWKRIDRLLKGGA